MKNFTHYIVSGVLAVAVIVLLFSILHPSFTRRHNQRELGVAERLYNFARRICER